MKVLAIIAALLVATFTTTVAAQYPDKPIKVIVPYSAGSADVVARLVAQKITEQSGKTVIVENKSGAGGRIGLETAARAASDGYTFVITDSGYTLLPSLYPNLGWDSRDLVPVTLVLYMPFVLTVGADKDISSLSELIARAKADPAKFNYGSAGIGGANHVVTEFFKRTAGIEMTHIPYRGMGEAMTALLGGQVDVLISTIAVAGANIKAGRVVGLVVPSKERSAVIPNVPTSAEAGLPGFVVSNWLGLLAPKGTPADAIDWMQKQVATAVATSELKQRFDALAVEGSGMTAAEFGRVIKSEEQRWGAIVQSAGIKSE